MMVTRLRWSLLTVSFFVLTFGGLVGIYLGGFLPTFSCYFIGKGKYGGACFLYPLQAALQSGEGWQYQSLLLSFIGFSLLIMILGRIWCGWICPLGFIQDLFDLIRRKLRIDYLRFPQTLRKRLTCVKWIFLFSAVLIPLWVAFPVGAPNVACDMRTPFCSWCPARYMMPLVAGDPQRMGIDFKSPTALTMSLIGVTIAGLTLYGALVKRRFFCAYCPMGLFIYLYKKVSAFRLKKNLQACTRCEICYNVCPMEIEEVFKERTREDVLFSDCLMCLRCVEYCPEDNALRLIFLKKTVYRSTRKGFFKQQQPDKEKVFRA